MNEPTFFCELLAVGIFSWFVQIPTQFVIILDSLKSHKLFSMFIKCGRNRALDNYDVIKIKQFRYL